MIVPLWIKLIYTVFVVILVPFYWLAYGPANFLWASDIALFATLLAIWTGNRLVSSMMAVGVLLPELVWNVDYVCRLVAGPEAVPGQWTSYMFNTEIPLVVRALSLFHVALPALLIWLLYRFGYDRRALACQTLLAWLVLPVTYLISDPSANINWVYGIGGEPQTFIPEPLYLVLLMVGVPMLVYLPTHLALAKLFSPSTE